MHDSKPVSIESHLANFHLFYAMGSDVIERIARLSKLINVRKDDVLFRVGDVCSGFYLLVYGQVKLALTSTQGNEKILEIVQQGQTFGEATMFLECPYIAFAQALQDSVVIHIPRAAIQDELEHEHGLAMKLLATLAKRTHVLMMDVEAYSLLSAKQRVIGYLLSDIPPDGNDSNPLEIELSAGKAVIASRLNITKEYFSRTLNDLSQLGLIVVRGKCIQIPSVSNLLRYHNNP